MRRFFVARRFLYTAGDEWPSTPIRCLRRGFLNFPTARSVDTTPRIDDFRPVRPWAAAVRGFFVARRFLYTAGDELPSASSWPSSSYSSYSKLYNLYELSKLFNSSQSSSLPTSSEESSSFFTASALFSIPAPSMLFNFLRFSRFSRFSFINFLATWPSLSTRCLCRSANAFTQRSEPYMM